MKMLYRTEAQSKNEASLGRIGLHYSSKAARFGIYLNHEVGDLSEYNSQVNPDGQITVDAAAALAGTNYGLKVVTDDTTQQQVRKNYAPTTDKLRMRVLMSYAVGAVDAGNYWTGFLLNSPVRDLFYIRCMPARKISVYFQRDSGYLGVRNSGEFAIGETICIEVNIERATTNISSDGLYQIWLNGVQQVDFINVDNIMIALTQ